MLQATYTIHMPLTLFCLVHQRSRKRQQNPCATMHACSTKQPFHRCLRPQSKALRYRLAHPTLYQQSHGRQYNLSLSLSLTFKRNTGKLHSSHFDGLLEHKATPAVCLGARHRLLRIYGIVFYPACSTTTESNLSDTKQSRSLELNSVLASDMYEDSSIHRLNVFAARMLFLSLQAHSFGNVESPVVPLLKLQQVP
ncbi:unnamed protein product [Musa acuminata var. zebrina]